jgi:Protein of unknown function (DUF4242)
VALIVVERTFDTPVSDPEMDEVAERERPCREIRGVTWKRSVLSNDRRRMICEYGAPDAETVRKVQREAVAPFDRIWAGKMLT